MTLDDSQSLNPNQCHHPLITKIIIISYIFQDVYFPTVIVCNINQNRRSLFRGLGITNESRVDLLYKQFYSGMDRNLTKEEQEFIFNTATSEVMLTRFWPFLTTYLPLDIGEGILLLLKRENLHILDVSTYSLLYPLILYCEE